LNEGAPASGLGAASGFTWPAAGIAVSAAQTAANRKQNNILFKLKAPVIVSYSVFQEPVL